MAPAQTPPGRNDPCPCGSGRRYKQCHGAATAPLSADALARSGVTAHARGDVAGAEGHYLAALAANPGHPLAQHYLGVLRYQQGRLPEALELIDRSVAAIPAEPEFHNNRGLALAASQRDDEAIAAYEQALELAPGHAGAWSNLGLARQNRNDIDGAIAAFRRGLESAPDFPQLHWNLALALLLRGDSREGWKEYEWRLRTPELAAGLARYPGPVWAGEDLAGRTILVTPEQGLGDAIQHLRFVAPLAAHGARVVVVMPAPLARLAATAPGVATVVTEGTPLPPYDLSVPLMSLPHRLDVHGDELAPTIPYLRADASRVAEAKACIAREGRRLSVGVAWAGATGNTHNLRRSVPLAQLAPLFDLKDVGLFSLKRDGELFASDDAAWIPRLVNLPQRNDFDALAALVASLDVIVSVDTSLAHLAGALGKPLLVPLAFVPDWRWRLERPDSPWYPTARLYRQRTPGDWSGPVHEIAQALRERLDGR